MRTGIPPPQKKKIAVHASKIPGTVTDYIGATVILCPGSVELSVMFHHQWKCKHDFSLVMFRIMCINYTYTILKDQQMHFGLSI
jgi:hypothetical protein